MGGSGRSAVRPEEVGYSSELAIGEDNLLKAELIDR